VIFFSPLIWLQICQRFNIDSVRLATSAFMPGLADIYFPKPREAKIDPYSLKASVQIAPSMHRFHEDTRS
jgi:hypothetical protein